MPDSNFLRPEQAAMAFSTQLTTWLRFRLPEDTSQQARYLHFSGLTDSIVLYREDGVLGLTGSNVSDGLFFLPGNSRYSLKVPSVTGVYLLRLSSPAKSYENPFTGAILIQLVGAPEQLEKLNELRRSGYADERNANRWFLSWIFIILVLVVVSWRLFRYPVFGFYAMYVAMVFIYYLVRKVGLLGFEGHYLRSILRTEFELLTFPLVFFFYARFIMAFLKAEKDLLTARLRVVMKASLLASLLILVTISTFGLYWGGTLALWCRVALALYACSIVWLLLGRKDRPGRLIAAGVVVLLLGFSLIMINNYLKGEHNIDLEPGELSFMQYAVLGELVLYWLGLIYTAYDLREEYAQNTHALQKAEEEKRALAWRVAAMSEEEKNKRIVLVTPRREYILARPQVQGFVAERDTSLCLLVGDKTETIPLRLGELEKQLPPGFFRAQRSYIINLNRVNQITKGSPDMVYLLEMEDGISLGKGKRIELRQLLGLDFVD